MPADTLYFHAQYRQASPNRGWTSDWTNNGDPKVDKKANLNGEDNYVWMEATGRGQFAGVSMSVLQNQDYWWGEGDDMFFVDGEKVPSINGTGSEDYFLGAWDFGTNSFAYPLMGAHIVGEERAGSPGPLDNKTPCGLLRITSSVVALAGTTVMSAPMPANRRRMLRFTP